MKYGDLSATHTARHGDTKISGDSGSIPKLLTRPIGEHLIILARLGGFAASLAGDKRRFLRRGEGESSSDSHNIQTGMASLSKPITTKAVLRGITYRTITHRTILLHSSAPLSIICELCVLYLIHVFHFSTTRSELINFLFWYTFQQNIVLHVPFCFLFAEKSTFHLAEDSPGMVHIMCSCLVQVVVFSCQVEPP